MLRPVAAALTSRLARAPAPALALYAGLSAFAVYFGMYAFRKPFTAASFDGATFASTGVALKTAFVIAQVLGYTLSKYVGVGVAPALRDGARARALIGLVVLSELALVAFALLPADWKVLAIFANGLPLGMVWGLVVRYLEGRRTSDVLLAGLATSFIVASGVVKDVGRWLMRDVAVSEAWMPAATGALFLPGFLLAVWLLDRVPPPSPDDVAARAPRPPMDRAMRRAFLREHAPRLLPLFAVYVLVTAYRDFRDSYGVELFDELGYGDAPSIFTRTEVPVALGVLVGLGLLGLVRDHRRGLRAAYGLMSVGALVVGAATWLYAQGRLEGATWMIAVGLGSYLVYVPFNTVLFERFVAASGAGGVANAVLGIQVADALGYTGSVAVMLGKDLGAAEASRLTFFVDASFAVAALVVALLALALLQTRASRR